VNLIRQQISLSRLMRWYRLSRPQLDAVISSRLGGTLENAGRSIPYYRDLFREAGYVPDPQASGPQDLLRLPVTTKADIKKHGLEMMRPEGSDFRTCHKVRTSGSTGIPLEILRSPSERAEQVALWLRTLRVNGYTPRLRVLALSAPSRSGEGQSLIQRVGLFRRQIAHYLLPPEESVDILWDYRPHVLYGNRQQIDLIALELARRGLVCDFLKMVVAGGAVVRKNTRLFYRKQLGCDLVENYGCEEAGVVAHDTPGRDGLHLCEEMTITEFLDEDDNPVPEGTMGRVVITTLNRFVQPFIRYDLGDRATYRIVTDARGHRWKRITAIHGRECDYIVMPNGSRRVYYEFYDICGEFPGLVQCRVIQKTLRDFRVEVVGDEGYVESIRAPMLAALKKPFPSDLHFSIVRVDQIPTDPSGKIRMFVTELESMPDFTPSMHRPANERDGQKKSHPRDV